MANKIIEGYALLWNISYPMSGYIERIDSQALSTADLSDVRLLRDHNASLLLARNTTTTLRLQIDGTGLYFRATLPDTALGEETAELIARGDLSQMSWGFTLEETADVWTKSPAGVPIRTIKKVLKVYDVSPVTYPANPATKVWASRAEAQNGETPEIEQYSEVLNYIQQQNSDSTMKHEVRSKGKESSFSPFYECASHQVNNEARAKVLRKAKEVAGIKEPEPENGDWKSDLEAKQKYIAELQARNEREYAEFLKREAAKKQPVSWEQTQAMIRKTQQTVDRVRREGRPSQIITSW